MNIGKFKVIANGSKFKIIILFFLLVNAFLIQAQSFEEERFSVPKRFIDKIEIFGGPSINFPDDNGWYDRVNSGSQGQITGEYKGKVGYSLGFGVTHSVGNRFEINGRLMWDRKGYMQENVTIGNNNTFKYEANAQNDYLTSTIAPDFFITSKSKFYVSSGIFYSRLLKSFIRETSYFNDQISSRSSITNSPEISKYDTGILLAIGYSLPIDNKTKLYLRLQANYGLVDIVNVNGLVINASSLNLFVILKHERVRLN